MKGKKVLRKVWKLFFYKKEVILIQNFIKSKGLIIHLKKIAHKFLFKIFIKLVFYFLKSYLLIMVLKINLKIVFINYDFKN